MVCISAVFSLTHQSTLTLHLKQFDTLPTVLAGPEQMQPGDLVFISGIYNNTKGMQHTISLQIYNQMVQIHN